jgi:Tfp pilus assembly protein PilX
MLIRQALTRGLRDERGQSLVLALMVMTFLAVALGAVMFFSAGNQRNANYQKASQVATSLAEAGVNNAVSVLSNPNSSCCLEIDPLLDPTHAVLPGPAPATPLSKTYNGNTVTWWGSLNTLADGSKVWTVYGHASVPNPTGPSASPVVKQVSAQVLVHAPLPSSFNVGVWNTVYSPFGPSAGCDTSIGQGINISVPLYVGGNLCMGQNAVVTKPVYVGGFLTFQNKQGSIGSNATPINSAHVGGYCQVSSGGQVNPCKSEPIQGNQPNTNVWVTGAPNNLTGVASDFVGISAPQICWNGAQGPAACGSNTPAGGWYTFAAPGPLNPCPAGSTGGYPTFDNPAESPHVMNDTYQSTPFNLTPAASYTCKIPGQGELSWDATNRVLTVAGTIFFDGSITLTTSGNAPITYKGWGSNGACTQTGDCQSVIYASGDISITSEKVCAVLNAQSTDCAWNTWDPNKKILIFASNGPTGVTVGPSQTSFQGGLYATNTVSTGQSALTEGPLVSGTKTVVLGQQFGGTFPPVTIAPFSIQKPPGGYWIDPPTNFNYGS